MNIDEAIRHAKEISENQYICKDCKDEHKQLAEWLEELSAMREKEKRYRWHDLRKNPDDLPEIEHEVEVAYITKYTNGKAITTRAVYEDGSIAQSESAFDWEDYMDCECGECTYNDEKDEYMIPVGWFEAHWYGEERHEIYDAEIIAWREIEPFEEA